MAEIVVAAQTFKTKKALEEKLRAMLYAAPLGVELDEPEHSFLLCVLFRHPEALKKVGCGVKAFRVTTTEYKNRCFEVIRTDGSYEEFSYPRCVKGEPE
jgi:DNA-directed RNA polymerase-4 subunit 1